MKNVGISVSCISGLFSVQRAVLEDDGQEISDDDSWGDELEKELEGGESAVSCSAGHSEAVTLPFPPGSIHQVPDT